VTTERPHPKPGDVCVCCEHKPSPYGVHTFQMMKRVTFKKTDGTRVKADWVFICDHCFQEYVVLRGGLATDAPITGCFTWTAEMKPLTYREPS